MGPALTLLLLSPIASGTALPSRVVVKPPSTLGSPSARLPPVLVLLSAVRMWRARGSRACSTLYFSASLHAGRQAALIRYDENLLCRAAGSESRSSGVIEIAVLAAVGYHLSTLCRAISLERNPKVFLCCR